MNTVPHDLPDPDLSPTAQLILQKRYLRKDIEGEPSETSKDMFWRVASAIAETDARYGGTNEEISILARAFYELMTSLRFLPNSPTLMNAGSPLGQLAACFVLPVGDSIEEIFDAVKYAALIHKSGGGTGFSFSRLRSRNSRVGSTGGVASGPLSFLKIFNTATEQIKQGGTRRGANMGILRIDHPDITEFINAKQIDGELNNFNLSVGITDEFMQAFEADEDYKLIDPHTGKCTETRSAREVFALLVDNAWKSGDPGIIFLDRINRDNPVPAEGEIEATNPCGEQPLLPYEACNLGSINLSVFTVPEKDEPQGKTGIDWQELGRTVELAVHFLDNVIDASRYPLPQIDKMVHKNRKIGLGVMGFADLLFQLEIPYNSEEAINLAENIMGFINKVAHEASAKLASQRGPFKAFKDSRYFLENMGPYRNATVTTIAPTGTLSILANCSSGIEPLFALSLTRSIMDGKKFIEFNQYFKNALKEAGLAESQLAEEILQKGSIKNMQDIPEKLRSVFVTAHDIEPQWHLRMQAAFQRHTDNAVSKTVNLPHSASRKDIEQIYLLAWKEGCKGVTVYRDGCKSQQVLTPGIQKQENTVPQNKGEVRKRPDTVRGFTQKVQTGLGSMYLTINEIDGQPFEVFATIGKSGRSITAKAEAIGRLVSLALRSGISVKDIVDQIKGIGGEHPVFRNKGLLLSIPDAIARVLEKNYLTVNARDTVTDLGGSGCPECGGILLFQEGCLLCPECGYSRCN